MAKEVSNGLNSFLVIIIMLFMIGLVVFIFIIGMNAIKEGSKTNVNGELNNETLLFSTECQNTSVAGFQGVTLSGVVLKYANGTIVSPSLYTVEGGCIKAN